MFSDGDAGHETASGSRAESGGDLTGGGGAIDQDSAVEYRHIQLHRPRGGDNVEGSRDDQAHHHDIAHRPEPRSLTQRDPYDEDQRADGDDNPADQNAQAPDYAFLQHIRGSTPSSALPIGATLTPDPASPRYNQATRSATPPKARNSGSRLRVRSDSPDRTPDMSPTEWILPEVSLSYGYRGESCPRCDS